MKLLSVNVGEERVMQNAKKVGKTGIYKLPASHPVAVTRYGLEGDAICDVENHGGVDQAVYLYGAADYAWWAEALQKETSPGLFGENLTLSDMESAAYFVGDRFHIGGVILEATSPRIPCITLARRMEDNSIVKRFLEAERPGIYCRVIQEGSVQAGENVGYERYAGERISLIEMMRDFQKPDMSEKALRRFLAAPIALRAWEHKEALLWERHGKRA